MKIPNSMWETLNNCVPPRVRPGRHKMFLGGSSPVLPFRRSENLVPLFWSCSPQLGSIESSFLYSILSFEAYHFLKNDDPQLQTKREGIPSHGMSSFCLYGWVFPSPYSARPGAPVALPAWFAIGQWHGTWCLFGRLLCVFRAGTTEGNSRRNPRF
jgi:hypothetical protein